MLMPLKRAASRSRPSAGRDLVSLTILGRTSARTFRSPDRVAGRHDPLICPLSAQSGHMLAPTLIAADANDPNVWSGRALQEDLFELGDMRSCINVSGL